MQQETNEVNNDFFDKVDRLCDDPMCEKPKNICDEITAAAI